ncbi:5'/3'-nucleotidase SurE [Salinibacterium sp. SYSU T00001]|uniref:5'/3'-nucleotidase SurE n=1 Tax=Homoserinimonas sedimenticola TaxID=2986805 RepID=UPI00223564BD|nr:5'/3'-nucleotidase SurE [Salinibacterium sedimenticola]MCW4386518.1 5'/3'-nucleotidase SurE [Salinibacterium sedimenticola]
MTKALITNDDGIDSPGLHRLAQMAIDAGLEVAIAGPSSQSSGSSASILGAGPDGRVPFARRELEGFDVPVFAVDAAPALISLIAAHGAFGFVPDIVFSGVNRGANVGHAILHSGTVGAALTAGVNGARGLAVSLDVGMDPESCLWDAAAPHVARLVPMLLEHPPGTVFNLNVPNVSTATELREGPLAAFGIVQTLTAVGGDEDVRLEVSDTPADQDAGTDAALLREGFATLTSITSVLEAREPVLTS